MIDCSDTPSSEVLQGQVSSGYEVDTDDLGRWMVQINRDGLQRCVGLGFAIVWTFKCRVDAQA
jgi:hypothetical protein